MREKLSMQALGRMSAEQYKSASKTPLTVVLDNVRSMNNVGSVFRSSDAFRVEKIMLCGITPTPPHREINKTALGATDTVPWDYCNDTLQAVQRLKAQGYLVYAVEQTKDSIKLQDFTLANQSPIAIIFGNEVDGVDQKVIDICHGVIEIEQWGTKHSLNIAVTCGIVLFELFQRLRNSIK